MDLSDKKILVAEDDEVMRNTIVDQLAHQFIIIPCQDGAEALAQIDLHRPDVIILDILMPKMDGFEVLKKLRENPNAEVAKTPVLVVSNLADQASIQRAKEFDIVAYFTKTDINFGILVNRIKRIFTEQTSKNA